MHIVLATLLVEIVELALFALRLQELPRQLDPGRVNLVAASLGVEVVVVPGLGLGLPALPQDALVLGLFLRCFGVRLGLATGCFAEELDAGGPVHAGLARVAVVVVELAAVALGLHAGPDDLLLLPAIRLLHARLAALGVDPVKVPWIAAGLLLFPFLRLLAYFLLFLLILGQLFIQELPLLLFLSFGQDHLGRESVGLDGYRGSELLCLAGVIGQVLYSLLALEHVHPLGPRAAARQPHTRDGRLLRGHAQRQLYVLEAWHRRQVGLVNAVATRFGIQHESCLKD
mmetsp:Transcript_4922/g.11151  ORF Transcript_4922/g.11151 Transcript_4922/m.11151 type:complete len:286 (+) Transcript_4922:400-1257(+)